MMELCTETFNPGRYEGDWIDDQQHGFGTETWPDGAVYKGCYVKGMKHGKGLFKWADGSSYEGFFVDSNIEGYGINDIFTG